MLGLNAATDLSLQAICLVFILKVHIAQLALEAGVVQTILRFRGDVGLIDYLIGAALGLIDSERGFG